jgi:hypothetical protein
MSHGLCDGSGGRKRSTFEAQLRGGVGLYCTAQIPAKNEVDQHSDRVQHRQLANLVLVHQPQRLNRGDRLLADNGALCRNREARGLQRLRLQDGPPDIAVAQQTNQLAVCSA